MSTSPSEANMVDFDQVRASSILRAVSEQRNNALNEVANLQGDMAKALAALEHQIKVNKELAQLVAELRAKYEPTA